MTLQELYARVGGSYHDAKRTLPSDALIGKFLVKFLSDRSAGSFFAAYDEHRAPGMFESAHTLKGVCSNLGLTQLSAAASELAEEFRPGAARTMTDAEVARRVEALRADYVRTVESIRAFAAEQ